MSFSLYVTNGLFKSLRYSKEINAMRWIRLQKMNGAEFFLKQYLVFFIVNKSIHGETVRTEQTFSADNCYNKKAGNNQGTWCGYNEVQLSCHNISGLLPSVLKVTLFECSGKKCEPCCGHLPFVQNEETYTDCGNMSKCRIPSPQRTDFGCLCKIQFNCTYLEPTTNVTRPRSTLTTTKISTSLQTTPAAIATPTSAQSLDTTSSVSTSTASSDTPLATVTTTSSPSTTSSTTTTTSSSSSTSLTRATTTPPDNSSSSNNTAFSQTVSDSPPVAAIVVPIILILVITAVVAVAYCFRHKFKCCENHKTDHATTAAISNAAYTDQPGDDDVITKHPQSGDTEYSTIGPCVTSIGNHVNTKSVTNSDYDVTSIGSRPDMPDPTYNHLASDMPLYGQVTAKHDVTTYDHIGGMSAIQKNGSASSDDNTYNTIQLGEISLSKSDQICEGENIYDHATSNDHSDHPPGTEPVDNDKPVDETGENHARHEYFVLEKLQM